MSAASGPRKWHTKSRTGCQSCKSRKIKCDEHHPSCRNCIRKGVQCSFTEYETPVSAPARLDLELLHNWTIATAPSLTLDQQVRDLWRIIVPQMGFSTQYILNGILALSALHMARHKPARSEALYAQATQYHTASLKEALPLIPAISAENCGTLFLFGVLTLIFNLASTKADDDMLVIGNDGMPEWLYLLRGMAAIVDADKDALLSSPVSLIFTTTVSSFQFWSQHSPLQHEALIELEAKVTRDTANDIAKREVLLSAIRALRRSYTFLYDDSFGFNEKTRGFYTWVFQYRSESLSDIGLQRVGLCILYGVYICG